MAVVIGVVVLTLAGAGTSSAATLPSGFQERTVLSGLANPTSVAFSPDGRIFVAEKSGLIKIFDSLADTTPTTFADLRTNVYNYWDRGLLGLALDPGFPTRPYVYVLYTYDAAIGGTAPRWGTPGATSDNCPTPPGPTSDGCVASGRLSRLQAAGDGQVGPEQVLIEGWCQQYPGHSMGDLEFGPDGSLYVSGGDGASFAFVDYGQDGNPPNPCGDPPLPAGNALSPPSAEGGALRSQDLRTSGDPAGLNGAILRVDPDTGAALPTNPLASNPDPNARRIIAYGLRNPFRFTLRPGTSEIWLGDVGWNAWEELDRVVSPTDSTVENFGWPCYEGVGRQAGYSSANLKICQDLYAQSGAVTSPYHTYSLSAKVVASDNCPTGSASIAGTAFGFYGGGPYPAEYDGALFFADYSRDCIWAMERSGSELPSPSNIKPFVQGAANPVDLKIGLGGDLFYPDFDGGTVRRVVYTAGNQTPVAVATASPTSGPAPLTVQFDGSGSSDPDAGDTLTYSWDLNGDGQYGDSTSVTPSYTYTQNGTYTASLRVTDSRGASDTAGVTISVGNTPPRATITAPASTLTWAVGDRVDFSGSASDDQDGPLPATSLSWSLVLHHCPSTCHTHAIQDFTDVSSGSFNAPDHTYPSYLELRLTATDSQGLTDTTSLRLDPKTVAVTLNSSPDSLQLVLNDAGATAPFTRPAIMGSTNTISAPSPQTTGSTTATFSSWSDGGSATHNIVANSDSSYTATFSSTLSPPDTVIDSLSTQLGGKATAYFHGVWRSPSSSRSFQCAVTWLGLFVRGWASCSSPRTYTGLPIGFIVVFMARAIENGVVDPTPALWSFRVR